MCEKNQEIRKYAQKRKVFLWEVGARFGVKDSQFSRRLREEFSSEDRERAMQYIDEIAEGRETLCRER